jgi:hypothetical protein
LVERKTIYPQRLNHHWEGQSIERTLTAFSPEAKRSGHETGHSPSSDIVVNNANILGLHSFPFPHGLVLNKQGDIDFTHSYAYVHTHVTNGSVCCKGQKKELRFAAASSASVFNGELVLAAESDLKLQNLHIRTICSDPVVV